MPLPSTLLWSIIVESINAPMTNTSGAKESSKINFPKEALLVQGVYKLLLNSSENSVAIDF
jgi:lipopolysaccharide transport system permease protein